MPTPLGILNIERGTAEFLIIHHEGDEEHEGSRIKTLHGGRLSGISSLYI
jgi:hypothetical protein